MERASDNDKLIIKKFLSIFLPIQICLGLLPLGHRPNHDYLLYNCVEWDILIILHFSFSFVTMQIWIGGGCSRNLNKARSTQEESEQPIQERQNTKLIPPTLEFTSPKLLYSIKCSNKC
jgi:hypothetical protein